METVYVEYYTQAEWVVTFRMKGKLTQEIVRASSSSVAKQIVQERYGKDKVQIIGVKKVDK